MKLALALLPVMFLTLLITAPADAKGTRGGTRSGHASVGHSKVAHTGTGSKVAHERVSGYTKKNGTRVASYDRSTRDATKNNNWSTKGNRNPETGKTGRKPGE